MLQKLREHTTGWIAKIVLGLLVFAFSFFGIETYFQTRTDTDVAHVGDLSVSQQDFQDEINNLRQLARDPQSGIDAAALDDPDFRRQVLDRLINQRLLIQTNDQLGITVTDKMVRDTIASEPAFQINGEFDPASYQALLAQQGLSAAGFQERVRQDLSMRVISDAVTSSALATSADVDGYLRLRDQTRDIRYVDLPAPEVDADSITDEEIGSWYEAHQADYMTPETVTVKYLEIKASDMHTDIDVDDEALRERYERDKAQFTVPEQREVAHILVSVPANATPEQQKDALAKAEAIEKKLDDGADFAKLAEEDSDDLGSKRQGGDLGWIEQGMTDDAFDEVAFSLSEGEVSKPVLSQEGYHIIKVSQIKAGHTKSLAEVSDELRHEMLDSERERKYNDMAGKLVDLVYQDPTSLELAAKELGLKIRTAGPFGRAGGAGIAVNPDVVEAAFSDAVLNQNMTSDPVNLGDDGMLVLRLDKHESAKARPLAEVRDRVRKAIVDDQRNSRARSQAEALLAKLEQGGKLEDLAEEAGFDVRSADGAKRLDPRLSPQLSAEVFKMPHPGADGPSSIMVDNGSARYSVVQLNAVHAGDLSEISDEERQSLTAQLQQVYGNSDMMELMKSLRNHTKVKVKLDQLDPQDPLGG